MEVLVDGVFYIWESQADNLYLFPVCMLSTPLTLDKKNDTRQKKKQCERRKSLFLSLKRLHMHISFGVKLVWTYMLQTVVSFLANRHEIGKKASRCIFQNVNRFFKTSQTTDCTLWWRGMHSIWHKHMTHKLSLVVPDRCELTLGLQLKLSTDIRHGPDCLSGWLLFNFKKCFFVFIQQSMNQSLCPQL